jgi:hypothetical protein
MPLTVKQASRPDSKKKAVVVPDVMMITFDVLQRYFLTYVSYAYAPTCTRKLLSFFSPHAGSVRRNLLVLMPREMKSYTTFVVGVTAGLVTSANYVFAHIRTFLTVSQGVTSKNDIKSLHFLAITVSRIIA